jgi:hypothetical protein
MDTGCEIVGNGGSDGLALCGTEHDADDKLKDDNEGGTGNAKRDVGSFTF